MPQGQGRHTAIRLVLPSTDQASLEALTRALSTPAGLARRARVILLVAAGTPISQVARTVGMNKRHVYGWVARYQTQGVAGLLDQRRGHREVTWYTGGGKPRNAAVLARQFLYGPGTRVYWACAPQYVWRIYWQRITYREHAGLGTVVEYGLECIPYPQPEVAWACEADLVPWEERP